jgi:hypothetical protein
MQYWHISRNSTKKPTKFRLRLDVSPANDNHEENGINEKTEDEEK